MHWKQVAEHDNITEAVFWIHQAVEGCPEWQEFRRATIRLREHDYLTSIEGSMKRPIPKGA